MSGVFRTLFGGPSKSKQQSTSSSSSASGNYAYPAISAAFGPAMGYTAQAGNMLGALLGLNNGSPAPAPAPSPAVPAPMPYGGSGPSSSGSGILSRILRPKYLGEDAFMPGDNLVASSPSPTPSSTPLSSVPGTDNQTAALDNWANSGGMQFLRDQGIKAIEGSRAARGLLQSGATGTELLKFGQGLGSTYLNQYMDQLLNHARLGLGAGGLIGSTGSWSRSSGTGQSSGKAQGEKQGILPMIASAIAGAA